MNLLPLMTLPIVYNANGEYTYSGGELVNYDGIEIDRLNVPFFNTQKIYDTFAFDDLLMAVTGTEGLLLQHSQEWARPSLYSVGMSVTVQCNVYSNIEQIDWLDVWDDKLIAGSENNGALIEVASTTYQRASMYEWNGTTLTTVAAVLNNIDFVDDLIEHDDGKLYGSSSNAGVLLEYV